MCVYVYVYVCILVWLRRWFNETRNSKSGKYIRTYTWSLLSLLCTNVITRFRLVHEMVLNNFLLSHEPIYPMIGSSIMTTAGEMGSNVASTDVLTLIYEISHFLTATGAGESYRMHINYAFGDCFYRTRATIKVISVWDEHVYLRFLAITVNRILLVFSVSFVLTIDGYLHGDCCNGTA